VPDKGMRVQVPPRTQTETFDLHLCVLHFCQMDEGAAHGHEVPTSSRHAAIYMPAWVIRAKNRDSVASQPAHLCGPGLRRLPLGQACRRPACMLGLRVRANVRVWLRSWVLIPEITNKPRVQAGISKAADALR
jgi:hypothetical protein